MKNALELQMCSAVCLQKRFFSHFSFISGFQDWTANEDLKKDNQKAPLSCCIKDKECRYSPSSGNIFMEGCMKRIELPYRIVFWAIPGLMAFMLMSALIVCSRNKNSTRRHKPNR